MSFSISPNLPANVVEIGNELSQARLDAINNGIAPTSGNPFTTVSYITGLSYATQTYVTTRGYLTDAPSNGSEYIRKNGAWSVVTGGGGITDAPNDGQQYARKNLAWEVVTGDGTGLADAPSDGSEYVRKDGAWSVATGGGGGGLTISTLSNSATSTLNATAPTTGQALTFDGTDLAWATVGGGGGGGAVWGGITGTVTDQTDLVSYINGLGYLTTVPNPTANPRTSGTHTLLSSDWNNCIVFTGGGTLEIPQDYILATPIGTRIYVCNMNSSTNIVGLTDSTETTVIYGTISGISVGLHILIKTDTNEWFIT